MGPLYRLRRFQDTIKVNSPSFVSSGKSSSPLLREVFAELLQKRAVERVQDPGTPGFYFQLFLVPKKNGKLRPVIDLSLLNQYIRKKLFQDGDSQVNMSVDSGQRLNCLHRPDRCLPTCSDSPTI